ncbi:MULTISPECIES: hypothetical protein [Pseudomonas]|jgi:hypothetical protein|uniref:Uncharacterized protein n=2 Tax=Pseudomonas TaxID=286 RepID=A0A7X1GHX0_9PSED|nr:MULTISPECIES: hypothetical protein [Pseudomonas]MBC2692689.1 hypothetical protein [Pseudomonas kielensis]MDD1009386.1 hypothetical protein [Pseudomonas shahriarae]MDZ4264001.1 hypothetical protein [Pseudomonadota bacterium]
MKTTFFSEFLSAAKEAPRLYFAPLIGAARAIKAEFLRVEEESDGKAPLTPTAKH